MIYSTTKTDSKVKVLTENQRNNNSFPSNEQITIIILKLHVLLSLHLL